MFAMFACVYYMKHTQGLALLLSTISSSRYNNAITKGPVFQPIAIIIIYLDDDNNNNNNESEKNLDLII